MSSHATRAESARPSRILTILAAIALAAVAIPAPATHADDADVEFAPYADVTLWPPIDLAEVASESGISRFTLAFVQSNGTCSPGWAGIIPIADDHMGPEIAELRAGGGDVIVSFGGAAGIPLAQACSSVSALKDAYRQVVDHYSVNRLDFDVEGAAVADPASVDRRSAAIAALQDELASQGRLLEASLTLPVLPSGLVASGISVVESARDAGVDLAAVNIMAMDYGDSAAPNPDGRMGRYGIEAATSLHTQLASIYPARTPAQRWAMVGITPMIGQNDVRSEVLTVSEAGEIADFATSKGIGRLSMWSVHRDRPCANGPSPWASPICSGIDAARSAFAGALSGDGATPSPPPPPTTQPLPPPPPMTQPPPGDAAFEASSAVTSDWRSGYCATVTVSNSGAAAGDWAVTVDVDAGVTTLWSANWSQAGSQLTASGLSWNRSLDAGADTTFGYCARRASSPPPTMQPPPPTTQRPPPPTTQPPPPPTTQPPPSGSVSTDLTIKSDWSSGYCAAVEVTNVGTANVGWELDIEINGDLGGAVTSLWNANWSQSGTTLHASGVSWNTPLAPGAGTSFGFCAAR